MKKNRTGQRFRQKGAVAGAHVEHDGSSEGPGCRWSWKMSAATETEPVIPDGPL